MARYLVRMAIKGTASIEVEADDEARAIREAAEAISFDDVVDWDVVRAGADVEPLEGEA